MQRLIDDATDLFEVTRQELTGPSRLYHIVVARHAVAWALRRSYPDLSLKAIAKLLGWRNHTTVMYAIERAEQLAIRDADYALRMVGLLR